MTARRGRRRFGLAVTVGSLAVGLLALGAVPALGVDNGTVNATVTVEAAAVPCIVVDTPVLDFGILPLAPVGDASLGGGTALIESCSSAVVENVSVAATDPVSTTSSAMWDLDDQSSDPLICDLATGINVARLIMDTTGPGGFIAVSNPDAYQYLNQVAGGGALTVPLEFYLPCAGSDGAGETMAFQMLFLATIP